MSIRRIILTLFFLCAPLISTSAFATPVRCSYGYQDSSCTPKLVNVAQTPPTCPAVDGWTTAVAPQWIGSGYSAPQCAYQAPPTCAPGYDEQSPAVWNGANWVGLNCVPGAPVHTQQEEAAACAATGFFPTQLNKVASIFTPTSANVFTAIGTTTGAGASNSVYAPIVARAQVIAPTVSCNGGQVISQGSMPGGSDGSLYDVFTAEVAAQNPNTGQWGDSAASICYVPTGTATVAYQTSIGLQKVPGTCH
ncbi:hypothetical protein [Paraburkholderia acidisoli]|uniref:Secreted protein n=1 Tax=Paraburkholderia acidisoli TaxID=2571748 RepID=A0A7Z2GSD9_9BURK|nr:hypothetical protein [Paraburkholderia acidisoli]QGZ66975.1 hypothetical protein FAZ98_34640 [Paraburkholderia acidisoli]